MPFVDSTLARAIAPTVPAALDGGAASSKVFGSGNLPQPIAVRAGFPRSLVPLADEKVVAPAAIPSHNGFVADLSLTPDDLVKRIWLDNDTWQCRIVGSAGVWLGDASGSEQAEGKFLIFGYAFSQDRNREEAGSSSEVIALAGHVLENLRIGMIAQNPGVECEIETRETHAQAQGCARWRCMKVPVASLDENKIKRFSRVLSMLHFRGLTGQSFMRSMADKWRFSLNERLKEQPLPALDSDAVERLLALCPESVRRGGMLAAVLRSEGEIPKPSRQGS
jgi:hypothetical protein